MKVPVRRRLSRSSPSWPSSWRPAVRPRPTRRRDRRRPRPATARRRPPSPAASSPPSPSSGPGLVRPDRDDVDAAVAVDGLDPVDVTNAGDGSGRLFVAEQAGRIRIVRTGRLVERPVPRYHRPDRQRRRARAARARLPPGLPDRSTPVRRLHGPATATPSSRRSRSTRHDPDGPTRQRDGHPADRPAVRQPQRRRRRVRAGRDALHRHGRRRRRRRSAGQRAATRHAPAGQDPAHRHRWRARLGDAPTRSRPTTRSSTMPTPSPRSGCTACAIRGGCASIARPATCGSATSARTPGRRSTSPGRGRRASTTAGTSWRASTASGRTAVTGRA